MTPSRIEPATCRLVAQCLKPAAPLLVWVLSEIACEVHEPYVSKFSFAGNSYITKNTQRLHKHCLGKQLLLYHMKCINTL